jgi:hypothetical protein
LSIQLKSNAHDPQTTRLLDKSSLTFDLHHLARLFSQNVFRQICLFSIFTKIVLQVAEELLFVQEVNGEYEKGAEMRLLLGKR